MRGKPYMPWPAAPKPMPGEVFGSWLGRVAARYRIGVDELNSASQIEVEIGPGAEAWLAARPVGAAALQRLSQLSTVPMEQLLGTLLQEGSRTARYPCCYGCLIMNPLELESPYWHGQWMRHEVWRCDRPGHDMLKATSAMLRRARNMTKLVEVLRRDRARRKAQRLQ